DGYAGIAPVKSFLPNGYGLYDMAGNVWEWCSDWYRADYYTTLADKGGVTSNPKGPESPFDPAEPNEKKRVHRGGSFLCNNQYCSHYIGGTRGKGEVNTGTNHLGFRCVKSPRRSGNSVAQTNKRATYPPGSAATIVMSPEVTRTVRSERLPVPRDMSILREDCSLSSTIVSRLFVIFPFTVSQWTRNAAPRAMERRVFPFKIWASAEK